MPTAGRKLRIFYRKVLSRSLMVCCALGSIALRGFVFTPKIVLPSGKGTSFPLGGLMTSAESPSPTRLVGIEAVLPTAKNYGFRMRMVSLALLSAVRPIALMEPMETPA